MMKPVPEQRSKSEVALKTFPGFFACGFGAGLSPLVPGTVGTLMAIPFGLLLSLLPKPWYLLAVTLTLVFGIWACTRAGEMLKLKDPGVIVWDEMVGFWIAVAFVPVSWSWWLAAFVLFRGFDILKPWPVSWADQRLDGGLGIMLDDVLAGLYTLIALWAFSALWLQ